MKTIKTVTHEYDQEGRVVKTTETTETIHGSHYSVSKCGNWHCHLCYPHGPYVPHQIYGNTTGAIKDVNTGNIHTTNTGKGYWSTGTTWTGPVSAMYKWQTDDINTAITEAEDKDDDDMGPGDSVAS